MTTRPQSFREMSAAPRLFIGVVIACGTIVLSYSTWHGESQNPLKFLCYLVIALAASRLKVNLPGITGTMSVNFLFLLLGVLELSLSETMALGCAAVVVQCLGRDRPNPIQIAFNVCSTALAIAVTFACYRYSLIHRVVSNPSTLLFVAACVYFVANTLPVAAAISLTERKSLRKIWADCYFWSFPYYLVGAGVAGMISWLHGFTDWQTSLLTLPVAYLIYRSYRLYLGKLEDEKRHVEEMADLHMRTIEALALAIEAKDQTTHDHLQRVRVYAVEVAKDLKVDRQGMEALQAAALLHDIGKLAIPEHIISKPGRLTPEEFEKMKIHPLVGAEILERVQFPYPVVPIVRAHHEKYDGTGYPLGLKGTEIPIGARILAAVDFLDALASDRQYRRALPLNEAMSRLVDESGKSFDPQVVKVLERRYVDLEQLVHQRTDSMSKQKLSTEVKEIDPQAKIEPANRPAAGFEAQGKRQMPERSFLGSIAAARQEAQTLFELSQDLGASLSLGETLSVFAVKLRRAMPYDAIAIYVRHGDELVPEYVNGDNFRLFASLRIPMGQGLSGWVAQNLKPILNGNPSVEPGYLNDASKYSTLNSALAVPLEGLQGVVGVVALYHAERDFFTSDHLRILLAVSSKMALAIENAVKYEQAESSAVTDYLTGLPNARSLFLQLDREMARCKRDSKSLTVMVADLDGFKQINDRFGHLEGNRVLRLFAHTLKETSREYDYVARMGGDEFVVIAPGLTVEAAARKAEQMRELAQQAGKDICNEDILSLSVGRAIYPDDGVDAEKILSEADKRMYLQKRNQSTPKNRRLYPRVRGRLTAEISGNGQPQSLGIITNLSLGGCYIETSGILLPGSQLKLAFSHEHINVAIESEVVRMDMGIGAALKFNEATHDVRVALQRILEKLSSAEAVVDLKRGQVAAGRLL
ncbi:MAG: diguanylate cyclase [Terriglobales bacterium]|jgi:diguanylate cyclase (GGDEF)-like protein/putative nucleotidyltransferase with HDIG domain